MPRIADPPEPQAFQPDPTTILGLVGVALFLRLVLPFGEVFQDDGVVFLRADPWYHMRLVDSLIQNFPQRIDFDPYALFPEGQWTRVAPLLDYLIAVPAWLLGGGSPSQRLVETVAALTPALLGAATVLPVWFLGSRLLGPTTGFLAAVLAALLPGHSLTYTLVGFTDHHAAEQFFSLATVTLLALGAEQAVAGRGRPGRGLVLQGVGAGLGLGAYLLSWTGGGVLLALIFLWGGLQVCTERLRGGEPVRIAILGVIVSGLALAVVVGLGGPRYFLGFHRLALIAGMLAFAALAGLAWRSEQARWRPAALPIAAIAAAVGGAVLCFWLVPEAVERLLRELPRFTPGARARTVGEVQSLFFPAGSFAPGNAIFELGPGVLIAPVGAVLLLRRVLAAPTPGRVLLAIWCLATVLLCVAQARFAIYAGPMVALLAALPCALWLEESRRPGFALGTIGSLLVLPSAVLAMSVPSQVQGPDPGWRAALTWMRANTPEPFADPDRFLAYRPGPPKGETYIHPESAYGVLNWWDYGYWVVRIGRRIPIANPTQTGASRAAREYLVTETGTSQARLREMDLRYVLVDDSLVAAPPQPGREPGGKFEALAAWADEEREHYYEIFYRRQAGDAFEPVVLFHPAYYQTLVVRLATFDGRTTQAAAPAVARYRERPRADGGTFKELISLDLFDSHAEATRQLRTQAAGQAILVGVDPRQSCVPLTAVSGLSRVYPPRGMDRGAVDRDPSRVAIFAVR